MKTFLNTLFVLGMCLMATLATGATLPEAKVLIVDVSRIESATATLERLRTQAEARTHLKPEQVKESLELGVSEILTILPEAVATVARERQVDLVVQAAVWPEGTPLPDDATDAVIAEIDRRLAKLELVVP